MATPPAMPPLMPLSDGIGFDGQKSAILGTQLRRSNEAARGGDADGLHDDGNILVRFVWQHLTEPADASGDDEDAAEEADPGAGDESGGTAGAAEGQDDGPVRGRGEMNHLAVRGLRFVL